MDEANREKTQRREERKEVVEEEKITSDKNATDVVYDCGASRRHCSYTFTYARTLFHFSAKVGSILATIICGLLYSRINSGSRAPQINKYGKKNHPFHSAVSYHHRRRLLLLLLPSSSTFVSVSLLYSSPVSLRLRLQLAVPKGFKSGRWEREGKRRI